MTRCFHTGNGELCTACDRNKALIRSSSVPDEWLQSAVTNSKFTVVIFYRGTWCIGCQSYLKSITSLVEAVRNAGGEIYAVCSQQQHEVDQTAVAWNLNYDLVSDPQNTLAKKYEVGIMNATGEKMEHYKALVRKKQNVRDRGCP